MFRDFRCGKFDIFGLLAETVEATGKFTRRQCLQLRATVCALFYTGSNQLPTAAVKGAALEGFGVDGSSCFPLVLAKVEWVL